MYIRYIYTRIHPQECRLYKPTCQNPSNLLLYPPLFLSLRLPWVLFNLWIFSNAERNKIKDFFFFYICVSVTHITFWKVYFDKMGNATSAKWLSQSGLERRQDFIFNSFRPTPLQTDVFHKDLRRLMAKLSEEQLVFNSSEKRNLSFCHRWSQCPAYTRRIVLFLMSDATSDRFH